MEQNIKKYFLAICMIFLCIPILLVTIRVKVKSKFSAEPITGNFKKNFPLKEDFYEIYALYKEELLNVNSIPEKVVQLNDGWLFCGDDFSDNLSESLHYVNFSPIQLDSLNQDLKEKNDWCNKNGIDFFLSIAPNKETVYSDLIEIKKLSKDSKMEQLEKICQVQDISYINLSKNFPKKPRHILYHKTDTHWNEFAGYYGYTSILESINKKRNTNYKPISIENYTIIETNEIIGDLNEIRGRGKNEKLVAMKALKQFESYKAEEKLTIPKGYPNDPKSYERRFKTPGKPLKVMILCDSFGGYFVKFLKEHFAETIFIWSHDFNREIILKEKPDIVIQEFVERNVDFLLKPEI